MHCLTIETPIGKVTAVEEDGFIVRILLDVDKLPAEEKETELLKHWAEQTEQYFARKRQTFDLPIKLSGTPFQLAVWQAIKEIDYGATMSYGQLAQKINRPKAVRAVGSACGANPVPLIIPCHRVVAKGGLGGFGLGLTVKKILLKLEIPTLDF